MLSLLSSGRIISPAAAVHQAPQPGGGYTGPLDLVPGAVVAYGQRALSAAKLGTALYTIQEDFGGTSQSFNSDETTGEAPVSAISAFIPGPFTQTGAVTDTLATILLVDATGVAKGQAIVGVGIPADTIVTSILSSPTIDISNPATETHGAESLTFTPNGNGFVWIDQSGNSNYLERLENPSAGFGKWIPGVLNNRPGFKDSVFTQPIGASISFPTGEFTIFVVSKGPAEVIAQTGAAYMDATSGSSMAAILSDEEADSCGAGYTGLVTDGSYILTDMVCKTGGTSGFVNGSEITANENLDSGIVGVVSGRLVVDYGDFLEVVIYDTALSAPNRIAIRQNIASYYGITLP